MRSNPAATPRLRLGPDQRSPCPLASALDLFGDRWTLLVLRDLACGRSTFKEFAASPERIATNILADRLKRLAKHGLVERRAPASPDGAADAPAPRAHAYALTPAGQSLVPVLDAIAQWGLRHIADTKLGMKPKS